MIEGAGMGQNLLAAAVAVLVLKEAGVLVKTIVDSLRGNGNGTRNGIPVRCPGPSQAFEQAARQNGEILREIGHAATRQTAILEGLAKSCDRLETRTGTLLDRVRPGHPSQPA